MRNKKLFIIPLSIMLVAFIFGIFFDYQIDSAIYLKNNLFSHIFASIGELPTYGGNALAGGLLFSLILKNYKDKKGLVILGAVVMIAATLFGVYYQGKAIFSINALGVYFPKLAGKLYLSIPVGLIIILPCAYLGYAIGRSSESKSLLFVAISILCVGFFQIGSITVIKGIFHRPRYRYLYATSNPSLFHAVFDKFGEYKNYITETFTSEEFKSFPSGHSASAAMSMVLLTYLPYYTKVDIKHQNKLFFIGFIYTLLLAFSRMLCGAHYLTDIAFGIMYTLVSFIIADLIFAKRIK